MNASDPLPLLHSWPLFERDQRFDFGFTYICDWTAPFASAFDEQTLARWGVGVWECDLTAGDALRWSLGVYDIFGLPRGAEVSRTEAVALYEEDSRATMERLRAYAIKHRRGFTLDAKIQPANGGNRWMRLVAAPICENDRVIGLQGLKRDVTLEYR